MTAIVKQNQISREKIELWKNTYCKGATDDELAVFINTCERTGMSPEARQIYAIKRWDGNLRRDVITPQFSIDAFRLIAERTGKYAGQQGPFFYHPEKGWLDAWFWSIPPAAAKIAVLRTDFSEPLWQPARFGAYAQKKKDGSLTKFWVQMPDVMIAKCAEALALRRAFPQELAGCYTVDEMGQSNPDPAEDPLEQPPSQTTPKTSRKTSTKKKKDPEPPKQEEPPTPQEPEAEAFEPQHAPEEELQRAPVGNAAPPVLDEHGNELYDGRPAHAEKLQRFLKAGGINEKFWAFADDYAQGKPFEKSTMIMAVGCARKAEATKKK